MTAGFVAFATFSTPAQVLWNLDFDLSTDLWTQYLLNAYSPPDNPPTVTYGTVDTGDPAHQNAFRFLVDSSANAYGWHSEWAGLLVAKPVAAFEPEHTYLQFDLLVYELKPVHVAIDYATPPATFNVRILELSVNPTAAGSFQRFMLPLTNFNVLHLIGAPPNNPTTFQFGIIGDPTNLNTWPSSATNMFLLDNIKYIVSPPLSISSSNNWVILSWPTNAVGFTLQQNPGLADAWTAVTNTPVVVNDQNQVLLAPVAAQGFYRLIGP